MSEGVPNAIDAMRTIIDIRTLYDNLNQFKDTLVRIQTLADA